MTRRCGKNKARTGNYSGGCVDARGGRELEGRGWNDRVGGRECVMILRRGRIRGHS